MSIFRRALMLPLVVVFELIVIISTPVTVGIALICSLVLRSSRPVRTVVFVAAYALVELQLLVRMARGVEDWQQLLREVLTSADAIFRRVLDVQVELEDGSATTEELASSDGVIVLARHCGPGDSLFIAWLLVVHHRLTLRIILTRRLRWEPSVDLAGEHLPLCFVGGPNRRARAGVQELASTLTTGEALLLFPEGGNFSWERWRIAIQRLTARGEYELARRARRRTHTLPPRPGGAVTALASAPRADVLLLAHSGLGSDGRDRPWWRLPVHQTMTVRTVLLPAATVPRDEAGAREFLDRAWAQVDTWVDGHAALLELAEKER